MSLGARWALGVFLGLAAVGAAPDRSQAALGGRDPEAVLEAALRLRIQELTVPEAGETSLRFCLAVDLGDGPEDPGGALLARLRRLPAVRKGSECSLSASGATESRTGASAVLVTAGPIDWVAGDDAWVQVRHFRDSRRSATRTYRVVRDGSAWVALGQVIKDAPVD